MAVVNREAAAGPMISHFGNLNKKPGLQKIISPLVVVAVFGHPLLVIIIIIIIIIIIQRRIRRIIERRIFCVPCENAWHTVAITTCKRRTPSAASAAAHLPTAQVERWILRAPHLCAPAHTLQQ